MTTPSLLTRSLSRRPFLSAGVAAVCLALLPVTQAWAAKQTVIPVLTCPFGCGIVAMESQLAAQMARDGSPVMVAGQETPGFNYNLRTLVREKHRWKSDAIATTGFILAIAPHGGHGIVKSAFPKPVETHGKIKLLFSTLDDEAAKFFVTFDPHIKTIADLKGKKVGIGLRKESEFGLAATLILRHYGITPANTSIRHAPPAALASQLLNGSVDAIVVTMGSEATNKIWPLIGSQQKVTAAAKSSGRKLYYVGLDKSAIEAINKEWGVSLVAKTIHAHTFPMQDKTIVVGMDRNLRAVHAGFPDKVAYQYIMAIAKAGPKLKKAGGIWALWSPQQMVSGLTNANVQPGAKRAYEKLGWWKLRKNTAPARY